MKFDELHMYLDKHKHEDFNVQYNYEHKYITIYFNDDYPIKTKHK